MTRLFVFTPNAVGAGHLNARWQAAIDACPEGSELALLGPPNTHSALRAHVRRMPALQVTEVAAAPVPAGDGLAGGPKTLAYNLYEWLKARQWPELVHLPDRDGVGLFCLYAKAQGLAFHDTEFVVHAGPTAVMRAFRAAQPVGEIETLVVDHMERRCLELADRIADCTPDLQQALRAHGVAIDADRVSPPEPGALITSGTVHGERNAQPASHGLLFIGTLGVEGGLPLACASLARMVKQGRPPARAVFAGPSSPYTDADALLKTKGGDWPFPWRVISDPSAATIAATAAEEGLLPVFVGPELDLPPGFAEVASLGVAFLVNADNAGCAYLDPADKDRLTFEARPQRLADLATDPPHQGARPITTPKPTAAPRSVGHRTQRSAQSKSDESTQPLVSVCVMHHERPELVQQALASIDWQTYPEIEIVLVDDGSISQRAANALERIAKARNRHAFRLIRQENRYLGAARNTGARAARGRYLFFLDDDNVLKPEGIATLVAAAERTRCDIVTSFSDSFEGDGAPTAEALPGPDTVRHVFTGDNLAAGLFLNTFGDSNALVARDTFLRLGGNTEDYGVGKDDHEFFARAVLNGARLTVTPEAVYWARRSTSRLRHTHFAEHAGDLRVARPYLDAVPSELRGTLMLAQGMRLHATRASITGEASGSAALRDELTHASQMLASSPRLQQVALRVYEGQAAAFRGLVRLEVRLAHRLIRAVRRAARILLG